MNKLIHIAILLFAVAPILNAQTTPDAAELTKLLNEFLAGASRSDPAIHDRFWAEDLIYTRSAGRRVSKADVMRDVRSAPAPKPNDPTTTYTAEDVRIQQYGATAIVAFRLVGVTKNGSETQTARFLNTGTFLKRDGKWQVVAWQSTRMPRTEQESEEQVLAAEAAFQSAILASDVDLKKLQAIVADDFVWTQYDGTTFTAKDLSDGLKSGKLIYSRSEKKLGNVTVYGDTAIVRGISLRKRTASQGEELISEGTYTLTFANQGSGWRAVAMHTSRIQP